MRTCPSCGADIPGGFSFCGHCGAALASTPAVQAEERKVVTVLFCDLVGFTARSDEADPEDVQARLRPYHARLRREIERFGGTLDKFIGDGVMAVFGAPTSHEDDPERAVRSALAMLDAVEELNQSQPGLDLQVRIGVTTGEAVVSLGDGRETEAVVGDVVNTASRLESAAPVGGIVVGEPTWRATNRQIVYEALRPVRVKGKARPLDVWRAVAARSRLGIGAEQRPATSFVDRDDELELLKRLYARALHERSVQLVTVLGAPGVGKSRLVQELLQFVDGQEELVSWRQGRCLPYGEGIAFWALGEIIKAEAGILESDRPEQAAAKLASALEAAEDDPGERQWLRARIAPLLGLTAEVTGPVERGEAFTAWRRFLEGIAARGPLVVVVEDLHWADAALLAFLEELVDWATDVPLLIVCTARPELYERAPGWGGGKRNTATISLSPLTDAEMTQLLTALVARSVLPTALQGLLLSRAGGNPLYAEELVRLLADRGLLDPDDARLRWPAATQLSTPDTVQALIAARLDTLPIEHKALLQDAAVVGQVFWSGALASMGGREESAVRQALHELARKEFVRPARRSLVEDQAQYSFWHVLVRDISYGQIPRVARARKHRAAAGWIEQLASERIADRAELLAHHYSQALALTRAVGGLELIGDLEQRARRFLVLAGDRAMELDVARAEGYYRQALELFPAAHPERAHVLAQMGQAAYETGRYADARHACEEAIAAFRVQDDAVGQGDGLAKLSRLLWLQGETRRSQETLLESIELLEGRPAGSELAVAYGAMASRLLHSGHADEALEWSDKAGALAASLGAADLRVEAIERRGEARWALDDLGGIADLQEALDLAIRHGLAYQAARIQINLAEMLWATDGPAAALEHHRVAAETAERRGLADSAMWARAASLAPLFELGGWDELLRLCDRVAAWDRARGGRYLTTMAELSRAHVLLLRGQLQAAVSLADEFLASARDVSDAQALVLALATAALIEQAKGRLPGAVRLVEEFDRAARDPGTAIYRVQYLPDLTRLCVAARELTLAERLLAGTRTVTARSRHGLQAGRAVVNEARRDLVEAARLYDETAKRWAQYGHVLERGQSLLGAGRSLLGLGEPDARDRLEDARTLFAGIGARTLVAETDSLLARTRPPRKSQ